MKCARVCPGVQHGQRLLDTSQPDCLGAHRARHLRKPVLTPSAIKVVVENEEGKERRGEGEAGGGAEAEGKGEGQREGEE